MAPFMAISCELKTNLCSSLNWVSILYNFHLVKWVYCVVQAFYIHSDFLCTCSIDYKEKNSEISNHNLGFFYFSILF